MTVLKRLSPVAIVAVGLSGARVMLGASGGPTAPQAIDVSAPLPEDSWQSGNLPGDVLTVTADPSNPAVVYASRNEEGVYKSTNGGASWGAINTGIFGTSGGRLYIFSLAIQPGTPSVLLAAVGGSGVFRSTTAGASWSKQLNMDGEVVAFDRVNLNTAYAGANSTGLFRTFNAGATWQGFLPNSFYCGAYTWDIIPDPLAGGHAYAEVVETNLAPSAGSGRLFVETFNSGGSCSLATFPGLPAGALVAKLGISAGGDAYAGTYSNGLYVRRVGTSTYTLLDATIPSAIVDMAFEPAATRRVYLGTATNGVYRCDTTCTPFSTGLADLRIRKLSLSTPPGRLYVATPTGLFSRGVDLSIPYPSCTVSALTVGVVEASVPGDLTAADCVSPNRLGRRGDVFSFQGTAGSRVRFSLRRGQGAAPAYDPYLILSGPDGQVLAFNDNVDSVCPPTTGTDACINYTLPATGTYYLEATSTNLVTSGAPYTLFHSAVPVPTLTLDKTSLRFGAVGSATSFVAQGTAQTMRLTQTGAGTVTWTASSSQPWLVVSPLSGTGSANLSISITPASGLPSSGWASAAISFTATGALAPPPIGVTLTLLPPTASAKPLGVIDTPTNNATGVTGAVPFTGWALDDTEVTRVMICRGAFGAEVAPVDPNCGGAAQIYVGDGLFIDGARPDVQATFPAFPRNSRAGWGFMVLTNMLPAQGNGTYLFYAYARDAEGNTTLLGTRTITCDNAHGTKPFGAIDTPSQGGTTSGASYVNFGWALTQNPKFIPTDGSTINVLVDGALVGKADYNHFRSDIAGLFPGLANSNAAVGFRVLDTTALANGLHTISWAVTDSTGAIEGIGSRFFTVANGAGAAPVPAAAVDAMADDRRDSGAADVSASAIAAAPIDETPLIGRRGWDLDAPWQRYAIGRSGRAVMRGEEIDRFELWLGARDGATYAGYLRVGQALAPLPIGSRLDPTTGSFTWAPGVGFAGPYDLVFVRSSGADAIARHEVRIILAAKGSGYVGVQVAIDAPRPQQAVDQPFLVGGWAVDLDAATGTGIDTLHVWAYPVAGGKPVFLGATSYGGARPDVGAVHGDQFRDAGFGLMVQGLPAGSYDLAVFPWSNVIGSFAPPSVVRVTVR